MITGAQLLKIMPLAKARAGSFLASLNAAMQEFHINTVLRQAAFLAQLAHESGQLRYMEEIASGAAYEGRKDLGNTQPGDGMRYKGRGPIQLTGRANYLNCGNALGLDLVSNPEIVSTVDVGCRVAGWFWVTKGLNLLADERDFDRITRRINGGTNGARERQAYYAAALDVLGDA